MTHKERLVDVSISDDFTVVVAEKAYNNHTRRKLLNPKIRSPYNRAARIHDKAQRDAGLQGLRHTK